MRAKSGRTTPVAGVVRPSAVSASTGGIPAALPQAFSLQRRELQVPAFGWRCTAADAASAVAAGVRLIDASGDANIEAALKAAAPTQTDTLLATALPSLSELKGGQAAVKAAEDAAARLGRPSKQILFYTYVGSDGEDPAAAAATWTSVCEALSADVGALGAACRTAEEGASFLRALQTSSSPMLPDVLFMPTSPHSPQRALLGLCRRLSVLPLAAAPFTRPMDDPLHPPQPTVAQALAWSCSRGVPSIVCIEDAEAAGADISSLMTAITAPLPPLTAEDKSQLNNLG